MKTRTKKQTIQNLNPTIPQAQQEANVKAIREAYTEAEKATRRAIAQIEFALSNHHVAFKETMRSGRVNWGFVGDLGHVSTLLTQIQDFLGNK